MRSPLLKANGLSKSYLQGERRVAVLDRLDLEITHGEKVALLGRSGSGKSTLLNLLGGIDLPDQGCIDINGHQLQALGERDRTLFRRRHIGYIYQSFNLIPTLTACENVALPLELNGRSSMQATDEATQMLLRVDLGHRADAFPDQLSGGEQQRIAIARSLVHRPTLILADEPTGNLDAGTGVQVLNLLEELLGEQNHGLFVVTHSAAVAERADRVLTLENGQLHAVTESFAW